MLQNNLVFDYLRHMYVTAATAMPVRLFKTRLILPVQ